MFEKELEEYKNQPKWKGKIFMKDEEICFKDGLELGYNKANEWHYVKNEDLPKYEEYVLIYTSLKNTYVARIPTQKDYFITNKGGYVQMSSVIAWKEFVSPKEIKEK